MGSRAQPSRPGWLQRHNVKSEKCLLQEDGLYAGRARDRLDPGKRKRHVHYTGNLTEHGSMIC